MSRLVCWSVVLLCSLATPSPGSSQEDTPSITFEQLLRRARENPPDVLTALAQLQRAKATERYVRGRYLPSLTVQANTGLDHYDRPAFTHDTRESLQRQRALANAQLPPGMQLPPLPQRADATLANSSIQANLDFTLLDRGRRFSVRAADADVLSQQSAVGEVERAAMAGAAEIFLGAVAADVFVEDAKLTLERRTSQYDAIAGLVKAGLRPSVDAQRAQIEVLQARYSLDTREIERRAAHAALATSVGIDPNRPLRPASFADSVLPAPLAPLEASLRAIEQRPRLKQLEASVQARRAEHVAAVGARLPTLGLSSSGSMSYGGILEGDGYEGAQYSGNAYLYLRWAALDPEVWRRAEVTRSATLEAQRQLEAALLDVRAEAVSAAYEVQRAQANFDRASAVLAAAQTARTAQNERYRAGVASLLDLLDAEEVEQNARRSRIESELDLRVARVRALAAIGTIDQLAR